MGNSSCGILEAPILKIPVINIGNRQKARLHARNVIFVEHNKKEIINALNYVMYNKKNIEECYQMLKIHMAMESLQRK